jgi:hypothetical protein
MVNGLPYHADERSLWYHSWYRPVRPCTRPVKETGREPAVAENVLPV